MHKCWLCAQCARSGLQTAWPSNSLAWALKQAFGSMELRFCDQNLLKPQLAFPHPHEGLGIETTWAGQWDQRWEFFFLIIFSKIPSIVCHANAVKPASFSFNIQFCDHMLIVGHVHYVPSLGFNRVLLRLYTHLCNNVVYARVLAVCTMCQAWPSNSLAWALKQASGSMELRFCDQDLFKL
jgi:hypothetical protein